MTHTLPSPPTRPTPLPMCPRGGPSEPGMMSGLDDSLPVETLGERGEPAARFDGPLRPKSTSTGSATPSSFSAVPGRAYARQAPALQQVQEQGATMKLGMSGPSVKDLQALLNDAGARPALQEDGKLGPKTEAALRRFQATQGSESNPGVLDRATLEALQAHAAPAVEAKAPVARAKATGALASRLADAAEEIAQAMDTTGRCAQGVNDALEAVGVIGRGHAFQKAEMLAHDPRFQEVPASPEELKDLPRGAIVVWGRDEKSRYGHVSIALGDGREASDHIQRQMQKRPGNSNDYGNGVLGPQVRVFLPVAD